MTILNSTSFTPSQSSQQLLKEASKHSKKTACLYVVATPLGNLGDITYRAVEVLRSVDLIAAEDTRHSQRLMNHYQIKTKLISLHEHNEAARAEELINYLSAGQSLALISDAGTPLIADPGFYLVNQVRAAGFDVVPIPGASALITALSAAGLPTDSFSFYGFLPTKNSARNKFLADLVQQTSTLVFYEAPHRILASLASLQEVFGKERPACVARELTKQFETFLTGSLEEIHQQVSQDINQQKGELVLLVAGKAAAEDQEDNSQAWAEAASWAKALEQHLPPSKLAAVLAKQLKLNKQEIYQQLIQK